VGQDGEGGKIMSQKYYHQYNGGECVARYPMHQDGGGVWFTGPIVLTDQTDKNGHPIWDHTRANEIFISRQPSEAQAIRAMRRKIGDTPPGAGPGEGWRSIEAEKRAAKMGLKEMAAKGMLDEA
jgi:hypothetical protein